MYKMKTNAILLFTILISMMWSCSEVKDWNDAKDSVPPGVVTDVKVKNTHGGAVITYKLPADDDLLGVKALYSYGKDGKLREAYSSAFTDTISLEGYSDTSEYLVKLYVIDKSKNESQPVEVTINPLSPPIELIRETLKVNPTFGGLFTSWENDLQDEISLSLFIEDDYGDMVLYDSYYSNASNGKFSFRGLENIPRSFRLEIRDKWDNYSSPLDTVLTPLFEEEIVGRDQTGDVWQRYGWDDKTSLYRGDITNQQSGSNRAFRCIHDGKLFVNDAWWHSSDAGNNLAQFIDWDDKNYMVFPVYFTIDMGKKASYSRLRYWMRNRTPYFSAQTFTSFEIWATNDPKPLDQIGDGSQADNLKYWTQWPEVEGTDEWKNDWTKLADCILTLPSGQTDPNSLTEEDREFIAAGFEFEMDPLYADTPFRYIRFVIRENRESNTQIQLSELKFWGAYDE